MQPVLVTNQYPDLYRFLAAMAEASYNYLSEPKLADKTHAANTIVIWSPEQHSDLLDSGTKLELIEHYARKLGASIVLSASANPQLQAWGRQLGWQVLWNTPDWQYNLNSYWENYEQEEEEEDAIAC